MTTVEDWSRAFNILWNNIMSNAAPGITEYEKGVFLTQAQLGLVKDYFSAGANALKEGFDDSSRRQGDFSKLVKDITLAVSSGTVEIGTGSGKMPLSAMFYLGEIAVVENSVCGVVPLSWQEYTRVMQKPYKKPPKGQVWRITSGNYLKFIPDTTTSYSVRYVDTPVPIDLTGNSSDTVTCDFPEYLHDEIVQRAVQLAKIAWVGTASPQS